MSAKHAKDLQEAYNNVAEGYQNVHATETYFEQIDTFIKLLPDNASVLDLGAGNGRDGQYFFEKGLNITLFDLSDELLSIAKKRVPDAKIVVGDMTDMHFPKRNFDGVWSRASLLHLTKDECVSVVKSVYAMLKKGGIFYCLLKEGTGEKEIEDDKYGKPIKRFFSFYKHDEFENLLKQSGFTILKSEIFGELGTQRLISIFSKVV